MTLALHKLVESKDCAVRARIEQGDPAGAAAAVEAELERRAHNRRSLGVTDDQDIDLQTMPLRTETPVWAIVGGDR